MALPILLTCCDYYLPPAKELHSVPVVDWRIVEGRLLAGGAAYRIDLLWLADRVGDVCRGDHEAEMRKYLAKLKGPLRVELAATKADGELFVSSLKPLDLDKAFRTAKKKGAPELGLSASAIASLDAKAYRDRVARLAHVFVAQRDLSLEMEHRGAFQAPRVVVRNRAKARTHKLLMPGEGSDFGRGAPFTTYKVEILGHSGQWQAIKPGPIGRCGTVNPHRATAELKPGATAEMKIVPPLHGYRFAPGRQYRVQLLYRNGALTLASNPVEFKAKR